MTGQDYEGIITNVQATSSYVKVQIDSVPGKVFTWRMTQFTSKPYPEVGKRIVLTAHPGRLSDYDVQQLMSISDAAAKETVSTEIPQVVGKEIVVTAEPPPSMTTLDQLAERILKLKAMWKDRFASQMLDFKWEVGHEIFVSRRETTEDSYRELEAKTGIDHVELFRCVKFFEKFPSKGYELMAWRKVVAELPAGKETVTESKPALVVDETHLWICPECGQKFEHVHVTESKHRLQECKAD